MKRLKFDYLFYIIIVLLLLLFAVGVRAQSRRQEKLTTVKIYLLKTGANYESKYPSGLFMVKRKFGGKSPLRSALEILTGGATDEEAKQNVASSTFGIKLVSVRIKNKTAYTRFTMSGGAAFPGENAPFIFKEAVEKTALQFRAVKRVVVCLDGILDFWSESDKPPKRCK
jgi:hypothetical protein